MVVGASGLLARSVPTATAQSPGPAAGTIVRIHLDGVVDPFVADHIESGIAQPPSDEGANAVLIEIDTPGGLVSSTRQITQAILNARIPVLCYVAPVGRARRVGRLVRAALVPRRGDGPRHQRGRRHARRASTARSAPTRP